MYIWKYVVNDRETMLNIPSIDRIEALREDFAVNNIFSKKVKQPGVKILGISWNYVDNFMFFNFSAMVLPAGLLANLKCCKYYTHYMTPKER
jgi:hypothetical protein